MHIIFATASFAAQYQLLDMAENVLEAWPKLKTEKLLTGWLQEHPDPDRVSILDSGVFSTWTLGQDVDIDAYIQYCKDNDTIWNYRVNCDVIPGSYGEVPTAQQVEDSADKGWKNYMYLIDNGLEPHRIIHVFHQGEDFKWLKKLMDYNDALVEKGGKPLYIGLSPANDRTTKQKILWLDMCMPYVTHPDGSAKVRWHGFGVTATKILRRYPFFSADSTS